MSEPPELSVALASYNRREGLAQALDALAQQTLPPERFEVIVVLDGSTDGSAELVRGRDYPYRLKLVEQDNGGLASARNRGAAEAAFDVVVFGDDDILLDPGCLEAYANAHRDAGGREVVLGAAWPDVPPDAWSSAIGDWWVRHYQRKAEPGHRWTFVDIGDGMASLPRRVFLETGGFDEAFRERRQDWEWGIRLFEHGVRFIQSLEASGRHRVDTSIGTLVRYARQEGRSDVQLGTKHPAVRARLLLARFAPGAGPAAERARAVLERPAAFQALARAAVPVAAGMARVRARSASERLVGRLRTHAYVLGMRDHLGDRDAFEDFLAPVARREHVDTLVVELDQPAPLEVPPVGGALELAVKEKGRELARVPAIPPGDPWDWDSLTERVVTAIRQGGEP